MTITLDHQDGTNILEVGLSGKLSRDDYQTLSAQVQRMLKAIRNLRLLASLRRFDGWTAGALWKGTGLNVRNLQDVERVAIVGNEKWQAEAGVFLEPFAGAQVRHFREAQLQLARAWLNE